MDFKRVVEEGKYYYPAQNHYPELNQGSVNCDRCRKTNLIACIGLDQCDLCLDCVSSIVTDRQLSDQTSSDLSNQTSSDSSSDDSNRTLMEQSMFKARARNTVWVSKMEQSMFKIQTLRTEVKKPQCSCTIS